MASDTCDTYSWRKRGSVEVNDGTELPIAKRIKGLSLGSESMVEAGSNTHCCNHNHQQSINYQLPPTNVQAVKYEPELSRSYNPHYYDANKVLFEAHMYKIYRMQER